MNYGKKLYFLRTRVGYSQRQIGDLLGIDKSLYRRYEMEEQIIPIKHLNTLCNYFQISLDYIFDFTNDNLYTYVTKSINKCKSGSRLKEFRKQNNLTLKKLATILNTTDGTLAGYESGRYIIATPFLYTICKKYNMSADYLLGKIDYIPDWCIKKDE